MSVEATRTDPETAQTRGNEGRSRSNTPGRPSDRYPAPRTLRDVRIDANLSLHVLADRAGILASILSGIETGRIVATTAEADALTHALELPAGSLVTRALLVHQEPSA